MDRQQRLSDFDCASAKAARILLIGAGGLGSHIACGLARKGYGLIHIADHDRVELSNLGSQAFFQDDVYQPKAVRLARNAARQGFAGSRFVGHFTSFNEHTAERLARDVDVAIVGVDNNRTRRLASTILQQGGKSGIFVAVNEASDFGWCFVQEPSGPCIGCVFPRMAENVVQPCRVSPSTVNILYALGGFALHAADSLFMPRRRHWNFREVTLVGPSGDATYVVRRRMGCQLCQR